LETPVAEDTSTEVGKSATAETTYSHSWNSRDETTAAVRTHQNQARQQYKRQLEHQWDANSRYARTGGNNINRRDVNHNRDASNSMDANNSRDQTLEQRLKSQLTTVTPWTSTAVRIAAETPATASTSKGC
jgi:hypothetical protein